ncbi:hypothetical protein Tco_1254031 [Tanacetum coccineum]
MVPPNNLGPNLNGKAVNETRYQANHKESHLIVVKRIFRYLKGTPNLGLWQTYVMECSKAAIYSYARIFCDNTSAIAISNNPVLHSRTKHIDIRYHFIIDHILKGDIELHFIPTQYQLADIFTKPLDESTFKRLIVELGGIIGEIGITTFRNAIGAHYSNTYVDSPSLTIVRLWFAEIGYNGEIRVKGTLKKSCLPPRWRLLMGQIIQCLGSKTGGLDQISNKDATILYCLADWINVDFTRII